MGEETRVNCLGLISGVEMLVIDAFTPILIHQIFTFRCGCIHGCFISKKHYGYGEAETKFLISVARNKRYYTDVHLYQEGNLCPSFLLLLLHK